MTDRHRPFASAYDDHVWDVYGYVGYRVGSREEAEDLTQATFERALKAWERFDPNRASLRTWLLAIARNLLVDHYRRKGSVSLEPLNEEAADRGLLGSELAPASNLDLDPDLEAALGDLSERDRELIALRFGGDLSGPEIAELTGLTLANVQQILSRTLRRLRSDLEKRRAVGENQTASSLDGERLGAGDAHDGDREQQSARARMSGDQP